MRKIYISSLLVLLVTSVSYSTTHTITTSNFLFVPSSITINLGDTVKFDLEAVHTAREVTEVTWNANATTSNGGFDLPNGGGTVVINQTGIHYYVCVPHASRGMKGIITINTATDLEIESKTIPNTFVLRQNYPNPFNPTTKISFNLGVNSYISLKIFDALGKEVETLVNEELSTGNYSWQWNGSNMSNGIYFYRLQSRNYSETKKMILLK